jgi:hypothetical protein
MSKMKRITMCNMNRIELKVKHSNRVVQREFSFCEDSTAELKLVNDNIDEYVTVANTYVMVDAITNVTRTLEVLFYDTNSIDENWYETLPFVTEEAQKGCRSTSVGDVISIGSESWIVASCGWLKLC